MLKKSIKDYKQYWEEVGWHFLLVCVDLNLGGAGKWECTAADIIEGKSQFELLDSSFISTRSWSIPCY